MNIKAQKNRNLDISKISPFYIVLITLFDIKLFKSLLKYLFTVISKFFVSQFLVKLGIFKVPVKNVEHPLDEKVPFKPEMVWTYLNFVRNWITALSFIRKHIGKKSNPDISRFLDQLTHCYKESYRIYKFHVSTTTRPDNVRGWRFKLIRLFDPHLYCVPSLHVIIVCFTFIKFREIYERHGMFGKVKNEFDYLYKKAIDITEAVIFVRQHSINCISSALFMVTVFFPHFEENEVMEFLSNLFTGKIDEKDRIEICDYMYKLYKYFVNKSKTKKNSDYTNVLIEFLHGYDKNFQIKNT